MSAPQTLADVPDNSIVEVQWGPGRRWVRITGRFPDKGPPTNIWCRVRTVRDGVSEWVGPLLVDQRTPVLRVSTLSVVEEEPVHKAP